MKGPKADAKRRGINGRGGDTMKGGTGFEVARVLLVSLSPTPDPRPSSPAGLVPVDDPEG